MNRRDALEQVALIMGGTLSAPFLQAFASGRPVQTNFSAGPEFPFSTERQALLIEVADTILPRTSTPGAKDAGIGPFIETVLKDCYSPVEHQVFIKGLDNLAEKNFINVSQNERNAILKEVAAASAGQKRGQSPSFFRLIKELTLFGYFNSEKGATQALDYLPVPGRYEGCIELKPGQKSWA